MDDPFSAERIRAAYDVAADDYRAAFGDDLANLPLDTGMLDACRQAAGGRVMLDVGCGTGAAASYLVSRGAQVVGMDLSLAMLNASASEYPFIKCEADVRALPFRNGAFAAATAFYALQHIARPELATVLHGIYRVLEARGSFLLATHLGDGEVYSEEFLGHEIRSTGGTLYQPQEIIDAVRSAGFVVEREEVRGPLAHEHQSQRVYLLVRRMD